MKRIILTLALFLFLFSSLSFAEKNENMDSKLPVYRSTMKELMGELKSELKVAMKKGGAITALEVCKEKASQISAKISKQAGFKIGRTSLKPRNVSNTPDEWEKKVLSAFETRKAEGESPKQLEFYQEVENEGQRQLRYMKAIPTKGICLECHGSTDSHSVAEDTDYIDEAVQEKLKELYPNDNATDFKVGDLRGAFSITDNLD